MSNSSVGLRLLLATSLLLSAFLLFSFQPMLGKMVLPLLGGAASVWTTAVLFFQAMLLAGYFYADRMARIDNLRRQTLLHLLLMAAALAFLPVRFSAGNLSAGVYQHPVGWELLTLFRTAAVPYLMVSTTAPLLQNWLSRTTEPSGRDPYFLYAVSNTGSLLALLAYPFFIEPGMGVAAQSSWWLAGYVSLLLLVVVLVAVLRGIPSRALQVTTASSPVDFRTRAYWLAAAFVPSGLMLGVTTHISVNLTPMPLVWTLPLAVYLLTFILAFGRRVRVSSKQVARVSLPVFVLLCPVVGIQVPVVFRVDLFLIVIHLILLFTGALLCHTALAASRPDIGHLTEYYVWVALGGALGGIFAAIVAPLLFTSILEYPLLLAAAVFFRRPLGGGRWVFSAVVAALVIAYALLLPGYLAGPGDTIYVTRNFFGVKKVVDVDGTARKLLHGDTLHGLESLDPGSAGEPLTYYHRKGPLGDVMEMMRERRNQHVGVVGLGTGSIAAYAGPNRHVTFFEIDPDVESIATRFFTFLGRCGVYCDVVSGDGRLSIARFPEREFDLLVLDAFSSDVIPPHLLSMEALKMYVERLKPDGVILFHASNRYLKVQDLVAALVTAAKLPALVRVDEGDEKEGRSRSVWVAAGRSADSLRGLRGNAAWETVSSTPGLQVWTDDYSNVIELLRWSPRSR